MEIIKELGFKEGQEVMVKKYRRRLFVVDWRK